MNDKKQSSDRAAVISAYASVAELVLLVIGAVLGYILVQRAASNLTAIQDKLESAKLLPTLAGSMSATGTLNKSSEGYPVEAKDAELEAIRLHSKLTNTGHVPISIKALEFEAEFAQWEDITVKGTVPADKDHGLKQPVDVEFLDLHSNKWQPLDPALKHTVTVDGVIRPGESWGHEAFFYLPTYRLFKSRTLVRFTVTVVPEGHDWEPVQFRTSSLSVSRDLAPTTQTQ